MGYSLGDFRFLALTLLYTLSLLFYGLGLSGITIMVTFLLIFKVLKSKGIFKMRTLTIIGYFTGVIILLASIARWFVIYNDVSPSFIRC